MTCCLVSPTLSLLFLLERAITSKNTPKTRQRLLSTEKPPHFNCSTSLNEQTKRNPGSPWALLIHTERQWHLIFIVVVWHANHPLHHHHPSSNWATHARCGGEKNEQGPALVEGRHTASLVLFKYG